MWCVRQGRGWIWDKFLGLFWRTCFGLRSHVLGLEWICLIFFVLLPLGWKVGVFILGSIKGGVDWWSLSKPCPFPTLTHTHLRIREKSVFFPLCSECELWIPQGGPWVFREYKGIHLVGITSVTLELNWVLYHVVMFDVDQMLIRCFTLDRSR